jgi:hypothetical protein
MAARARRAWFGGCRGPGAGQLPEVCAKCGRLARPRWRALSTQRQLTRHLRPVGRVGSGRAELNLLEIGFPSAALPCSHPKFMCCRYRHLRGLWLLALLLAGAGSQQYAETGPCGVARTALTLQLPEESECGSECTLDLQLHLPDARDRPGCPPPPHAAVVFYSGFQVRGAVRAPGARVQQPTPHDVAANGAASTGMPACQLGAAARPPPRPGPTRPTPPPLPLQLTSQLYRPYAHRLASWGLGVAQYDQALFHITADRIEVRGRAGVHAPGVPWHTPPAARQLPVDRMHAEGPLGEAPRTRALTRHARPRRSGTWHTSCVACGARWRIRRRRCMAAWT